MSTKETQEIDIGEDVENVEEIPQAVEETKETKETVKPEAVFNISQKAEKMKDYLTALTAINNEICLSIGKDGVSVRQMDASHVSMVDGIIPAKAFNSYTVAVEGRITVDVATILRILKRADNEDNVTLAVEEDKLRVSIPNKNFRLGTFENEQEYPVPKITLDTKVKLSVDALMDALTDVAISDSDVVRVITQGKSVRLDAKGDYVDADIGLDRNVLDAHVQGEVSATYSLEYLTKIVKSSKNVADAVSIEYDKDKPISLTFDTLRFLLAPRIEA